MSSVLRTLNYLKKYPKLAGLQFASTIGMALMIFPIKFLTTYIIDTCVVEGDWAAVLWYSFLFGLVYLAMHGLNALRIITNNRFEQNAVFDIRSELYAKIQKLPINWFDSRRTGDIMTRIIEDVTSMERVLIDGLEQGLKSVLQILIVLVILFSTNFQVGLFALIPVPFLVAGALLYSKNAKSRYKSQRAATSDMNSILHDNISGVKQIKTFAAEEEEHGRFNAFSNAYRQASLKVMYYWAMYKPSMDFLIDAGRVLTVAASGLAMIQGGLSYGELVALTFLLTYLYEPIRTLHQLNQMAISSGAAADRVFEILDSPEEDGSKHDQILQLNGAPDIELKQLSFQYSRTTTLKNISLKAKAGETVALIGATGAGKSSLVNLIPRFYEFHEGSLTINGQDIQQLNLHSLRSQIGYVTQDSFLFNGSVRANLQLGKRDASEEEIWEALELANAYQFVSRLPQELDTNIGERGVKLSGGEKQRLAIARAILKNAPILILDEATASVDNETEKQIQQALDNLMTDKTCFIIAHRLSTIKNADQIFVLDQGQIAEQGTVEELLQQQGIFHKLHEYSQLGAKLL